MPASVDSPCQIFGVHYIHSRRRIEVKFRFFEHDILLPIAEAEFRLGIAGLADQDASQAIMGIDFEDRIWRNPE